MVIKTKSLLPTVLNVILNKRTEPPFCYNLTKAQTGAYLCRQCGTPLFRIKDFFHSGCGWPSFDEAIKDHVKESLDPDGKRIEITCSRCQAHLGHVFRGERFTAKNTRHCVNSLALDFVQEENVEDTEEAIVAAGCFWGVEYYLKRLTGVLKTEVGYCGGHTENPSYQQVCTGTSGHYEAVRILYDPKKISYEEILKYFFEIHDPTQSNGQGPDIGPQYCSAIFYYNEEQKSIAEKLIQILCKQGLNIATQLLSVSPFYAAEHYHQDYYEKNNQKPYCHYYAKRFSE